jgi:glutaredoxin-like protein
VALIDKDDSDFLRNHFKTELQNQVTIIHFTQHDSPLTVPGQECMYCKETRQLLEEIAKLSDKLKLEIYDFVSDAEKAKELEVDKIPATILVRDGASGVRFYGIPSGYEFSSMIEDIVDLSRGESGLTAASKKQLSLVNQPVHVQVFVTPTCPYCPLAARLAHQMAMENRNIRADVIEASEFPQLVVKYGVGGVPKIVIGEKAEFEGALAEAEFVREVVEVAWPAVTTPSA